MKLQMKDRIAQWNKRRQGPDAGGAERARAPVDLGRQELPTNTSPSVTQSMLGPVIAAEPLPAQVRNQQLGNQQPGRGQGWKPKSYKKAGELTPYR